MQLGMEKEVKGLLQMSCLKPIFCQTIAETSLVFPGAKICKELSEQAKLHQCQSSNYSNPFTCFQMRGSVLNDRTKHQT